MIGRRDLAVVNRDSEALVLHAHTRDLREAIAQLTGCALEDGDDPGRRLILVIRAVRTPQLETVAPGVPKPGCTDPSLDVGEVATAQDRDVTHRRNLFQRLGRPADQCGRVGIGDDGDSVPS